MLDTLSLLVQLVGVILLVLGFRKSNRNMLLGAALCLWIGAGMNEMVPGFIAGLQATA
jgi:hypothetical protein